MSSASASSSSSAAANNVATPAISTIKNGSVVQALGSEEQEKLNDELWELLQKNIDNIAAIKGVIARDPEQKCINSIKIFHHGNGEHSWDEKITPLQYVTTRKKSSLVNLFLSEYKIDPNVPPNQRTSQSRIARWSLLGLALSNFTDTRDEDWRKIVHSFLRYKAQPLICERSRVQGQTAEHELFLEPIPDPPETWAEYLVPRTLGLAVIPVAILLLPFAWIGFLNDGDLISLEKYNIIKAELQRCQDEINNEATITSLQTKLTDTEEKIDTIKNQLKTVNTSLEVFEAKSTTARTDFIRNLYAQFEAVKEELTKLKKTNPTAARIRELEREVKKLNERIGDLQIQLNAQKDINKELYKQQTSQSATATTSDSQSKTANNTNSSQTSTSETSSSTSQPQSQQATATEMPKSFLGLFSPLGNSASSTQTNSDQKSASANAKTAASEQKPPSTDKPKINTGYFYEDDGIWHILHARIDDLRQQNNPRWRDRLPKLVILPAVDNIYPMQIGQRLQEEAKEHFNQERYLLIPCNLGNYHWVGIMLHIQSNNQLVQAEYLNSCTGSPDITFNAAIKTVYESFNNFSSNANVITQSDGSSCGPCTIENLLNSALDIKSEPTTPKTMEKIREHHLQALRHFDEKFHQDFDVRQRDNIRKVGMTIGSYCSTSVVKDKCISMAELIQVHKIGINLKAIQDKKYRQEIFAIFKTDAKTPEVQIFLQNIRTSLETLYGKLSPNDQKTMLLVINDLFDVELAGLSKQLDIGKSRFRIGYDAICHITELQDYERQKLIDIKATLEAQEKNKIDKLKSETKKQPVSSTATQQKQSVFFASGSTSNSNSLSSASSSSASSSKVPGRTPEYACGALFGLHN